LAAASSDDHLIVVIFGDFFEDSGAGGPDDLGLVAGGGSLEGGEGGLGPLAHAPQREGRRAADRLARVADQVCAIRSLILDLTAIEGPIVDPLGYFPSNGPGRSRGGSGWAAGGRGSVSGSGSSKRRSAHWAQSGGTSTTSHRRSFSKP
jgi:hypothetical protein